MTGMAERPRVLFLTAWYPTPEKPNWGVFVRDQALAVQPYADVRVLHCPGLVASQRPLWQVVEAEPGDPAFCEGLPAYRVSHRLSPISKTSYALHLWSIWRATQRIAADGFRPTLIHAHVYRVGVPAVWLARRWRVPLLIAEHYSAFYTGQITLGDLRAARWAFRRADRVLPVSRALQGWLENCGVQAHFSVVPNVVDTEQFQPAEAMPEPNGAQPRRLLFVGSLSPNKGVAVLLQALARLPGDLDWQLSVIGDGPERARLETLAASLRLAGRVAFEGYQPKAIIAERMRAAHLFVLPSRVETFSVAVAEALVTGLPVLATRSGGPEDLVTEANGQLIAPDDIEAMTSALCDMLTHLERYDRIRIAREAAARFAPTVVGAQLAALYAEVSAPHTLPREASG
jgi:glycosyltransferase involved in cell wall biosynthesis